MRRYEPREMLEFLRLLDAELTAPITVTVIGGAAIGLEYDTRHATTDIDLTPIGNEAFWKAVERARARLPDPVPVQPVGLYAAPYDYEYRRRPLEIAGLRSPRLRRARILTGLRPSLFRTQVTVAG